MFWAQIKKKINFKNRKCYNHTFDVVLRVIDYDSSLNKHELEENIIIAILHDVGRGIEIVGKPSSTPLSQNLDHTALGLEYLFDDSHGRPKIYNFLTTEFSNEQTIDEIRSAIEFHSTRTYPEGLPVGTKRIINNIRFCDKAAIMDQFVDPKIDLIEDVLNTTNEDFASQEITEELLYYFNNRHCVDRTELRKHNAYNSMAQALSHIGFIFDDSNDPRLFSHLKNTNWLVNYIQKFPLHLLETECKQKLAHIANVSKQYIDEKVTQIITECDTPGEEL